MHSCPRYRSENWMLAFLRRSTRDKGTIRGPRNPFFWLLWFHLRRTRDFGDANPGEVVMLGRMNTCTFRA